jgi:hypothetical protein
MKGARISVPCKVCGKKTKQWVKGICRTCDARAKKVSCDSYLDRDALDTAIRNLNA